MALFSRRNKKTDRPDDASLEQAASAEAPPAPMPDAGGVPAPESAVSSQPAPAPDPAASVGISVSTFRGVGAGAASPTPTPTTTPATTPAPPARTRPRAAETAPEPAESIPGLRDNVLLRDALAALPDPPTPTALMNVARQLLQGQLFLRVKGDARALLSEGRGLPLAVTRRGDNQLVLAYSSGSALQRSVRADGASDTSAVAQPVLTVLRHVLDGPYEGIVVDPSSAPARAVIPRPLLQRALDEAHPALAVKTLLAAERTPETAAAVARVLPEVPLWIAVRRAEDGGAVGIAESRTSDGGRYIEVFSHPLELLALGRGDQPLPITIGQLSAALTADAGLTGLLIDPAGPWIRLTRADLGPASTPSV